MSIFDSLDEVFHTKARLGIMTLAATDGQVEFTTLRERLGLTDGNLSSHLRVLEEAGYIEVEKGYEGRKPKTTVRPTTGGRKAFRAYLKHLEDVIKLAQG